jgi:hypothetical protein
MDNVGLPHERVAAMLVRVENNKAALIRRDPNYPEYEESRDAHPNCPFLASSHWNYGQHYAGQRKN